MEIKKISVIYLIGFLAYMAIEVIFGTIMRPLGSKIFFGLFCMGILGGIILNVLGMFNEIKWMKKWNLLTQCLIGAVVITVLEFVAGLILNTWLGLGVWDYTNHVLFGIPFHIMGQVSILFSFFWLLLCPLAFWVDDVLKWTFYKTGMCKHTLGIYNLLWLYKQLFNMKPIQYKEILEMRKK